MLKRIVCATLLLYALLTVLTIISVALGYTTPSILTPLVTFVGFSFAFLHAVQREGLRAALLLALLVFVVSLSFESVGVATGVIYGPYHYTEKLGSKFLGLVPYLIPVAWFMMSYSSIYNCRSINPVGLDALEETYSSGSGSGDDHDGVGCNYGSDHGRHRSLGVGSQRRLSWNPITELFRLVADGFCYLCVILVAIPQA